MTAAGRRIRWHRMRWTSLSQESERRTPESGSRSFRLGAGAARGSLVSGSSAAVREAEAGLLLPAP